ncbi:MAG: hypothetical protein ACRENK_16495 [Gemmatimonadaceae bacterium]
MLRGLGTSVDDVIALAQRMASNPADSVALSSQLVDMLAQMPPPASELLSRPKFDRASLWTLGCSFENVPSTGLVPPQIIRCQHDVWVRAVQIQVIPAVLPLLPADPDIADLQATLNILRSMVFSLGTNHRGLGAVNWRLDARQGFISSGQTEILAPAALVSGDGRYPAAKDWKLQKDQTIEVSIQNRLGSVGFETNADPILRWVTVCFWVEELEQPSVQ